MKKILLLFILLLVVVKGYADVFDGVQGLVDRRAPWLRQAHPL